MSKKTDEDRSAKAVTDRQTEGQRGKLDEQFCSVMSLF